ncbi:MAG: hypothetical protein NUV44_00975, partial [Candidatus Scalindua sp.]|nr:hypothetical protein [Candidatus Scalindua sp.]
IKNSKEIRAKRLICMFVDQSIPYDEPDYLQIEIDMFSKYGFHHTSLCKGNHRFSACLSLKRDDSKIFFSRKDQRLASPVIFLQSFTGLPSNTFYMLFGHLPD